MAIRWDEFPHHEIRLKIYARLAPNGVGRAAEDSKLHILRRQLSSLHQEDHRCFVELQARHLVEHLRCTRDVYREFVDSKGCHPVLEAQWVVLRCAVFPTAIAILPPAALYLIALGGLLYSAGVIFFLWERLRFQTAIWHALVLVAAICHYGAVVDCLVIARA